MIAFFSSDKKQNEPVRVMFKGIAGKVAFTHKIHTEDYEIECASCHHNIEEDGDEYNCRECHMPDSADETLKSDEAFHELCISCHKSEEAGPVQCNQCHTFY